MTPLLRQQRAGRASALVCLSRPDGRDATIGRWQHGDAEPHLTAGDGLIKMVVNLSNTHRVERLRHGRWSSKSFDLFSFSVVPPDEEFCFAVKGRADVLQVFLPQAAAGETDVAGQPSIRNRFQDQQPLIERYATLLLAAAQERCTVDELRLAELLAGLADLLAHDARRQSSHASGGLPPHRLRRVLDMVAAAVASPQVPTVTLYELADAAGLSPFHFARAFRETIGLSPCGYVLQRRLDRARTMLVQSTCPIAEVGRLAGFKSHAHFSSRFRRQMGLSPLDFRRTIDPDRDRSAY